VAADGTPRITWHGKDFAATTEIVKLGDVEIAVHVPDLADPWVRRFIAAVVACERIEGANRIAPAHVLEMAACRFLQKGGTVESWHQYETELGVTKSKTRPPRSRIQPFIKWARGGRNDTDGSIGRLAAAFDAWLALGKERPDPTPRNGEPGTSQLAEWLAEQHGYQEVAKAHNARLEYEAALERGTVWVTHADGTERIYETKAGGESQNEGPVYEEPAEWWDLQGCEPTGAGEYRRIDPETDDEDEGDPLPERIKGVVRPAYHHRPEDQKNYSESNSANTGVARRDREGVNQVAAHGLARLRQAESRTRTPHGAPSRLESNAPTPGDGKQWCPKCGKMAIPIAAPACRECEPNRTPDLGELSFEDLFNEAVRLRTRVKELEARSADAARKLKPPKPEPNSDEERVYVTPPEFYCELNKEFNFTPGFDPCPHPRPKGFDGLKVPWPPKTYCNSPFRKKDSPDRHGIAAFARKAIEQNKLGKTVVLPLPTKGTIVHLLDAGAEFRSCTRYLQKAGFPPGSRIPWIDPKTGQPATTSPSSNMLAILWGEGNPKENEIRELKARIAELEAENNMLKARIEELTSSHNARPITARGP
jgi:hypothetical protein